jgi:Putative zinc-finger
MTCEHVLDDGAYVLGALSPAERAEFERHLSTCATCREAVASLAVIPGLLGRLEPTRAVALGSGPEPVPAPPTLLPRVLAAAAQRSRFDRRRSRRRRTAYGVAMLLTVALLVVGVGIGVHMRDADSNPGVAMSAMRPAQEEWTPVSADVGLVAADGGSKLVMTCWYANGYEEGTWVLRLLVYPKAGGGPETIGTWRAEPGAKITVSGRTHLNPDQILRVELQRGDDTTLLWWSPS